ncbi:imidazole glycerol phosphate synthase subunit HisH [Microbacterium sp. APC 3898]|uniref:Imidazole glycerol phosphate synthase subunit HisH n=2 Tax=Planococcus TaxID=1372 RepID=A0ABT7ZNL9_9BACL|nr:MULTISPECIES: imidazole glycerol phosphate synthase subunit HisH [Terrabacteria group]MBD8016382.1 imidazole glycerol phosphate synthase subunit HisH [Planococcus wigleyi]MDN3428767.1 imidazole glycerol phosphate synthase subunit HisH [Planococcus sp. APC 4016]MDN3439282.1 imidazole glycerol phosphate synthase subunit HisH [Planococcus sp. APC 3900]MDN3500112.1 imidazole glycerol phosphate synthase subunit HisH [Microbacterium sp. APC 3898]
MIIGIIDYGMGNLFSVEQALKKLDCTVIVSDDPAVLLEAEGILLPGVGAFPDAMELLNQKGLSAFIQSLPEKNIPLLGICLGMQLLYEDSSEVKPTKGLGLLTGQIRRFEKGTYRIPHMGWNRLEFSRVPYWLDEVLSDTHVYFVHSFLAVNTDEQEIWATASYGNHDVPGVVGNGLITGMQFHPEKSGDFGHYLLEQWIANVRRNLND